MPKAKKRKPQKRGPKEERLVIRDDPAAALARPLKPNKVAILKAEFDAAHKNGMEALRRGDTDAFGYAVDREHKILKEFDTAIKPAPKRRK